MVRRLALTGSAPVTLLWQVSLYRSCTWWSGVQANTHWGRESKSSTWRQSWASLKLECSLCWGCQLSICWPWLRGPIMGTNPTTHYHGRLTFIGCCYHCTDQQDSSLGDSSVGEPLWTWMKSTYATSLKHGRSNNNNSKDGVCLWRAEILDCCLRGKSKPQGSCSQSLIDWPYWNHFIAYRCSSACSLSPGSSTGSIKPATLISGTNHANTT